VDREAVKGYQSAGKSSSHSSKLFLEILYFPPSKRTQRNRIISLDGMIESGYEGEADTRTIRQIEAKLQYEEIREILLSKSGIRHTFNGRMSFSFHLEKSDFPIKIKKGSTNQCFLRKSFLYILYLTILIFSFRLNDLTLFSVLIP